MWRDLRNRLLMSPRFQRAAAAFPLTRFLARREAREMFDVVAGFVYSQVLLACIRAGLLERLREGPLPVARLAAGRGLEPPAADTLLRAAEALELLESRAPGTWALGSRGAALLGNPGVLAMIEHHAVLYADLADPLAMLRAPRGSTALSRYWPYAASGEPGAVDPAATREYTQLMSASQGLVAGEILDAYPVHRHQRVLDVGGGDGTFLRAVAGRAPHLELMLADLPGVAAQAQLGLNEVAVDFAQARGSGNWSRWPGWGNLSGHGLRAGGHPGGICGVKQPALVVAANGFAVDAGDAGNLALGGVALQQRDDGSALVGFQDIHSLAFLRGRPEHASCPQVPTVSALRPCPRSIQVGEFEVAINGGIWVAIRAESTGRH